MNEWTEHSFNLHNSTSYLDNLHEVYPISENDTRSLDSDLKNEIYELYNDKKDKDLFTRLLSIDKFPIKDSYRSYFVSSPKGEHDDLIQNNPNTVSRICKRLYNMGWDDFIRGLEEPIEPNRQMGGLFRKWFNKQYTSYESFDDFYKSSDDICILSGSDEKLTRFVKDTLNVSLPESDDKKNKGLDLVVKINTKNKPTYVIGETKFLTCGGGNQYNQLTTALNLITSSEFANNNSDINIIRIAVLDGVCWIGSKKTRLQNSIRSLSKDQIAISALLLDEFFESILNQN